MVVTSSRLSRFSSTSHMLNILHWLTERYIFFVHVLFISNIFLVALNFLCKYLWLGNMFELKFLKFFSIVEDILLLFFLSSSWNPIGSPAFAITKWIISKLVTICIGHDSRLQPNFIKCWFMFNVQCLVPFPNIIYHIRSKMPYPNKTKLNYIEKTSSIDGMPSLRAWYFSQCKPQREKKE